MSIFHLLEVVPRERATQLQVCENLNEKLAGKMFRSLTNAEL